ncbi:MULTISPECIES: hypothetical protein [Methylobacterium]|uniref:hypothetical protein n=1 Tax=Methylobacterium TaxID=407 RepID=UPI0013EBCBB6|nr:hypothetical protein [Methylobacterium sp. DB0501]NGM33146.1 hypothetical protein [Methylobacterium sp. DB0501]
MIIKSFNTWAFKREQPGNPERLVPMVEAAARDGRPLEFVLYWGKGPRSAIAAPDLACLDYLGQLAERVRQAYGPGALIRLICTDTHASLNGHPAEAVDAYFGAIDAAARARGFATIRLSDVVAFGREVGVDKAEEEPSGEILASLIACAAKWYRGEGSTEQGALDYHRMNMIEKRAVAAAFPGAVFVTFNGSEFRDLFPATMPIFYMYSLRRGVGVKPWFMDADFASARREEAGSKEAAHREVGAADARPAAQPVA